MTRVTLHASDGIALEGVLREPAVAALGDVVLLHPHPMFGGTMDVWLLPTIAEVLARRGWRTLRINFRGVGGSSGTQTGGRQEQRDAEGAIAYLRQHGEPAQQHGRHEEGARPRAVVGWSFGAMIGLRLGADVDAWVGIAPVTRAHPEVPLEGPIIPQVLPPRRSVVVGSHDQFFPPDTVEVLRPHRVVVLPDADHFLFDRDPEVAAAVADALDVLLPSGERVGGPATDFGDDHAPADSEAGPQA